MKLNVCKNCVFNLEVNVVSATFVRLHFLVEGLAYFVLNRRIKDRIKLSVDLGNHFVEEVCIWEVVKVRVSTIMAPSSLDNLHRLASSLDRVCEAS
jgi:hypothetical protein